MLITFEGGEGSGKSTQIQLLAERLRVADQVVLTFREPGSTRIGEAIREVVLNQEYTEMDFATEVMLFQAQRAQLYHEKILPALVKKQVVLVDRSRDSSLIYQGMVRRFGKELIEELNTISTQDTYPDLTFLLDLPIELGLNRKARAGEENRLEKENQDFHQQVREAYLQVAKENVGGRWQIIDANQAPELIAEQIWEAVRYLLFPKFLDTIPL